MVPISDKNLSTLLLYYIEKGEYFNANKFLTELKNTESSIYNNIVNTVIPNANYKINSLKNKIEDAMIEESIQGQN